MQQDKQKDQSVHSITASKRLHQPGIISIALYAQFTGHFLKTPSINQHHAILNEVFKHGLTFKEGMFRTPWIHPEFEHNLLKINN